eukprot:scaffold326215_cov80-Tisochrysis_lutea.AAC.3
MIPSTCSYSGAPRLQRSSGTSDTRSPPQEAMLACKRTVVTRPGSSACKPQRSDPGVGSSSGAGVCWVALGPCTLAPADGMSPKYCASRRAVGYSKTSVLGRICPDAACSWFPSSTAPSESRPASIRGASASTSEPIADSSIDRIESSVSTLRLAAPVSVRKGVASRVLCRAIVSSRGGTAFNTP